MGNIHGCSNLHPGEKVCQKNEILSRVHDFPVTLRETIEGLKDEDPESFLLIVEETLTDLLYGIGGNGLDCERDTNREIETAIRFFPHVLCERYWGTHPPIYAQLAYFKSVPFIPLLAKLGIELNQFQEEERGGLFYYRWNVLRSLLNNGSRNWYDEDNEHQQLLVDEKYASAVKLLKEIGIFQNEDISNQDLAWELSTNKSFPGQRFRCLVALDPNSFYNTQFPIYRQWLEDNSARVFRIVFELGMLHFPTQMGFLFHREYPSPTDNDETPFVHVCRKYGTEKVAKIIRNVLAKRNQHAGESNAETINMEETFLYAATNPSVSLDCLYFLLRRDPGRFCQSVTRRCLCNS